LSAQLDELNLVAGQGGQALELSVQPTDVIALVREAAAARQLGSDTHRIEVETNVEELVGSVDATRLARVVDNLLANAAKYSPAGRDIKVQVQRVEFESQPWAVLAVRDEGIGIPPADLAHIFERFRRGGNVGSIPGSGVGLAAAREIVEAHGGTIAAESSGGAGSTFTVRLPLAE
jgi:signal transduction histidine kinase